MPWAYVLRRIPAGGVREGLCEASHARAWAEPPGAEGNQRADCESSAPHPPEESVLAWIVQAMCRLAAGSKKWI